MLKLYIDMWKNYSSDPWHQYCTIFLFFLIPKESWIYRWASAALEEKLDLSNWGPLLLQLGFASNSGIENMNNALCTIGIALIL